jgi:hypothetical protein
VEKLKPWLLSEPPKITNMKVQWLPAIFLPVFTHCQQPDAVYRPPSNNIQWQTVANIPLPRGYNRIKVPDGSFAAWLRTVKINKDPKVYLYDGSLKRNQGAQFAVLDISIGNKDLQQCADAVMRLRAEYLYEQKRYGEISFADNNGKKYTCPAVAQRKNFDRYLEKVFAFCGTASLEKQLKRVPAFQQIQPGDVLIKGGFPGHAVMVMDVASDSSGRRIYMLAQSYMPAQSIHLLINPGAEGPRNPWYTLPKDNSLIFTPEWTFATKELRRW